MCIRDSSTPVRTSAQPLRPRHFDARRRRTRSARRGNHRTATVCEGTRQQSGTAKPYPTGPTVADGNQCSCWSAHPYLLIEFLSKYRWDTQLAYTTRYPIPTAQPFDQHSSPNTVTNLRNSQGNRVGTSTEKKVARYTTFSSWSLCPVSLSSSISVPAPYHRVMRPCSSDTGLNR